MAGNYWKCLEGWERLWSQGGCEKRLMEAEWRGVAWRLGLAARMGRKNFPFYCRHPSSNTGRLGEK